MARQPDNNKRLNLAISRVIPPILSGIIVYACYAVTKTLCIDYLIHPLAKYNRRSRTGAGAAIIAVLYVLLLAVIITYFRLLYIVVWNPDYLPRRSGAVPDQQAQQPARHSREHRRRKRKKHRKTNPPKVSDKNDVDVERAVNYNSIPWDTAGLEDFYKKDIFVCQPDGRPLYCSKCCHYKPDRAHHCREVDQCVRKMDHFCPWVGGVVSETSFKFFIQFVFYTAILCIFVLVVCAIYTAELRRQTGDVNPHWLIAIGLSAFFGIFTFGMTLSSLQLAILNLTTIENLSSKSVVWTLAVRVPDSVRSRLSPSSRWAPTFRTITYPLPPMPPPPPGGGGETHQPPPPPLPPPTTKTGEQHVFAILQTFPGENPFDLGSPIKNLQQVLGHSILEWFLPLKRSPCANHSSLESDFALGPVVSRLKKEAGLEPTPEGQEPTGRWRRRRRRASHRQPERLQD